jgi:hypothetical protein
MTDFMKSIIKTSSLLNLAVLEPGSRLLVFNFLYDLRAIEMNFLYMI